MRICFEWYTKVNLSGIKYWCYSNYEMKLGFNVDYFLLKVSASFTILLHLLNQVSTLHFFKCYLAALQQTLDHYQGDSLTRPMLITAEYIFDPKVTGKLVMRLGT